MPEQPRFTMKSVKLSDLFRRFADLLDDPEKCKMALGYEDDGMELMEIISRMKGYAFTKMDTILVDMDIPVGVPLKTAEVELVHEDV